MDNNLEEMERKTLEWERVREKADRDRNIEKEVDIIPPKINVFYEHIEKARKKKCGLNVYLYQVPCLGNIDKYVKDLYYKIKEQA